MLHQPQLSLSLLCYLLRGLGGEGGNSQEFLLLWP